MSRLYITCVLLLQLSYGALHAQPRGRIFGIDDTADVIDHGRFDSLWRASLQRGLLRTDGAVSPAMTDYLRTLATAQPDAFLPAARQAFWTNAHMAAIMVVMHRRAGLRSTVADTQLFARDTFMIAGARHTIESIASMVVDIHGTALACVLLGTGSTHAPPLLRTAATSRTMDRILREQARRVLRSERFVFFDPGADAIQLSSFFAPFLTMMEQERGSVVQFLLPWLDDVIAAECALRRASMRVLVADRIEKWRRRR